MQLTCGVWIQNCWVYSYLVNQLSWCLLLVKLPDYMITSATAIGGHLLNSFLPLHVHIFSFLFDVLICIFPLKKYGFDWIDPSVSTCTTMYQESIEITSNCNIFIYPRQEQWHTHNFVFPDPCTSLWSNMPEVINITY